VYTGGRRVASSGEAGDECTDIGAGMSGVVLEMPGMKNGRICFIICLI
jgi:hypothetical protein